MKDSKIFKTQLQLSFSEADPAQIMYFANIFDLSHRVFEQFIVEAGYTWREWFQTKEYLVPIRHAEADYKSPLFPGDKIDVGVRVDSFGRTSFKMHYDFYSHNKLCASVRMVHSVLDSKSKSKLPLPSLMKERLLPYCYSAGSSQN